MDTQSNTKSAKAALVVPRVTEMIRPGEEPRVVDSQDSSLATRKIPKDPAADFTYNPLPKHGNHIRVLSFVNEDKDDACSSKGLEVDESLRLSVKTVSLDD